MEKSVRRDRAIANRTYIVPNVYCYIILSIFKKDGMNGLFEAGQPVDASNEDVLDAAGRQISDNTQPEVGALRAIAEPVTKHIAMTLQVYIQDNLDRNIFGRPLGAPLLGQSRT